MAAILSLTSCPLSSSLNICDLYQSAVLTLLYVVHGWNTSMIAKPLCFIALTMFFFRCIMSIEYPRATKVAPAAIDHVIGLTGSSRTPLGVELLLTPFWLVGDVCPFVSPYTALF